MPPHVFIYVRAHTYNYIDILRIFFILLLLLSMNFRLCSPSTKTRTNTTTTTITTNIMNRYIAFCCVRSSSSCINFTQRTAHSGQFFYFSNKLCLEKKKKRRKQRNKTKIKQ